MHTPNEHCRRASVAVLGLVLVSLGGCQSETPPDQPPSAAPDATAPTTPPAPSTTVAAEAQVLADYAAFWDAYVAASAVADADHPALAEHATGEALERIRIQLVGAETGGFVARGEPVRSDTRVTLLDGGTAEVAECLDSNQWGTYDAETGQQHGQPTGLFNRVTAQLTQEEDGGLWRVSVLDIGEGEATCAG